MTERGPLGVFDEHAVPEVKCPACGHLFSAASAVHMHGRSPNPGDLSVCVNCAAPLVFVSDLSLRRLRREEIEGLSAEVIEDLARIIVAVRTVRQRVALKRHQAN